MEEEPTTHKKRQPEEAHVDSELLHPSARKPVEVADMTMEQPKGAEPKTHDFIQQTLDLVAQDADTPRAARCRQQRESEQHDLHSLAGLTIRAHGSRSLDIDQLHQKILEDPGKELRANFLRTFFKHSDNPGDTPEEIANTAAMINVVRVRTRFEEIRTQVDMLLLRVQIAFPKLLNNAISKGVLDARTEHRLKRLAGQRIMLRQLGRKLDGLLPDFVAPA